MNAMAQRKVQKTVYIPMDVAERLEEQDNQSETVTSALREVFGE